MKKYQIKMQQLLIIMLKTDLHANMNKCKLYIIKISYLKLIIFTKKIYINSKNIKMV